MKRRNEGIYVALMEQESSQCEHTPDPHHEELIYDHFQSINLTNFFVSFPLYQDQYKRKKIIINLLMLIHFKGTMCFVVFYCSFVLSLADVDPHLMMEDDSLVWTSKDVVIVLQHQHEKIPLR